MNSIMNVAEVQLSYKSNVKSSTRYKINSSQDAYELLTKYFPVIKYPQPILKEAVNLYKTIPWFAILHHLLCIYNMQESETGETSHHNGIITAEGDRFNRR